MDNRRMAPRYPVAHRGVLYVEGRSGLSVAATSEVRDVSSGGLCLLTTVRAEPGDKVRVEIVPEGEAPIRGVALVVWCRRLGADDGPWTFAVGLMAPQKTR